MNVEKYGTDRQATDDNIIRRMRFACWITKATDTHSEYVVLLAFPRQQWLRERASMVRFTYVACLVISACCFNVIAWRSKASEPKSGSHRSGGSSVSIVTTEEPWFDFQQRPRHFPRLQSAQTGCGAHTACCSIVPRRVAPPRQSPRGGKMAGKMGDKMKIIKEKKIRFSPLNKF
jgi:hypothetical protein